MGKLWVQFKFLKEKAMKLIYLYLVIMLVFTSCQQQTNEHLKIQQTIDELHHKVMVSNEKAMKTKFKLDSLLQQKRLSTYPDTQAIQQAIIELNGADEKMMDWMQHFRLNYKGSETEALQYFRNQLDSLKQIETSLQNAIERSNQFIIPKSKP